MRARARLPEPERAAIACHAPVDASGLLAFLDRHPDRDLLTAAKVDAWLASAGDAIASALPGGFDVVASCCVLTQMSWALDRALGAENPMTSALREAMMNAHLRILATMLKPGGHMLIACDLISSVHHPLDELAHETSLRDLMRDLMAAGNFFRGANPLLLRRLLRRDPVLSNSTTDVRELDPWLWNGPREATYLVHALSARRS